MNKSIHYSEEICNSLKRNKLYDLFTAYMLEYIMIIIISIFSVGYKGKMVNMERHSDRHRTSISRFLNSDKWDETALEMGIKHLVLNKIYEESKNSGKPIFCIIDDTISSKTRPSSHAKHPIDCAYFHFSHLKKKQDYGHQAVSVMLSCNGITLNYAIIMYDKSKSKIEIVKEIAKEFPSAPNISYLLCDSWYVCSKVMEAFIEKGFYTVGALKMNRILYPYGRKISVSELARKLDEARCRELFHPVTVKGKKYLVYRYEGKLNDISNAVVILTYPASAFGKASALRAFISTNADISNEEILALYVRRWEIEVFFRNVKNKLAFDKYQIRHSISIKRLWLITSLAYTLACFESKSFDFSEGYTLISDMIFQEQLFFIFDFVKSGGEKSVLLKMVA